MPWAQQAWEEGLSARGGGRTTGSILLPRCLADNSPPSFVPACRPHPSASLLDRSHLSAPGAGHGALPLLADLFANGEFRYNLGWKGGQSLG